MSKDDIEIAISKLPREQIKELARDLAMENLSDSDMFDIMLEVEDYNDILSGIDINTIADFLDKNGYRLVEDCL